VRTIGFRGFSALGACFGEFVTMVSPNDPALRLNDFMWSATVWHEYAHVLTLALTKHRIPRWLTEGMSVHEESARNRTWERGMQRELLDAFHNGEIPPLRLLNRVFRGSQILFGYYLGGLAVEFLSAKHGFAKVVTMLKAYGEDQSQERIFQSTFGWSTREFDQQFRAWIAKEKLGGLRMVPRYSDRKLDQLRARVADHPADLDARVGLGWGHVQRGQLVEAGQQIAAVLRAKPEHGLANLLYGTLLQRRKEVDQAMARYAAGFAAGADDFESRLRYGSLLERKGQPDAALRQYQAAKACWPRCTEQELSPQLRIANLLRAQGKLTEAMMEMKAFCKLTARAFRPRKQLAEYARGLGNRAEEARFLEECIQIDPFMRSIHDRLGDAYVKLGKLELARREYEVALAVVPALDREYVQRPGQRQRPQVPAIDSPEQKAERGALCVKVARVRWALGDRDGARAFLDRAAKEAPDSPASDEAAKLRAEWKL
ncbi:MAG: tetratricopeptide repeat protein, partial [Planctomycetes bacterium]|nr:tetratricopeptide repeat protein [Planctomycetota bacterium]